MVNGGRLRWLRVVSLAGCAGFVLALSMSGCGGRTSTLDPDVYGYPGEGGDGNFVAPVGNAGKPGSPITQPSPTAGTSNSGGTGSGIAGSSSKPAPAGGKGGGGNVNESLAVAPCKKYCPGYSTDCAERLTPGQDCETSCEAEVNGSGTACQRLGINSLNCLTPFLKPGLSCDVAVNRGLAKCGNIVAAFQKCKGVPTGPTMPMPTMPMPTMPMPTMPPTPIDPTTCASTGSGDPNQCKVAFLCPNGNYTSYCTLGSQPDGTLVQLCDCIGPQGQMASGTFANQFDPCTTAARALCRFP